MSSDQSPAGKANVNNILNNILINGRTAVHRDSGGILSTLDVCLTPVGKAVVPIPYSNVARSVDAAGTASSVLINDNPACHLNSCFSKSTGDQPGRKKGIISGTLEGKAEFLQGSANVFIEGQPAVRQGELMVSNNRNTPPAPLSQPGGAAPKAMLAAVANETEIESGTKQLSVMVSGASLFSPESIVRE